MTHNVRSIASTTSAIASHPALRLSAGSRRGLIGVIGLMLIALFVWRSHGGLAAVPRILQTADLAWIGAAVASEVVALTLIVERSRMLLHRLGYRLRWWTLMRAYLRRKSISAVVPGGGAPAAAVFARDLSRADVPVDDAVYSIALTGLTGTVGTAIVTLPALFLLLGITKGGSIGLLSALILLVLTCLTMVTSLIVCQARWLPSRLTTRVPKRVNRFLASVRAHDIRLRDLAIPVLLGIGSNAAGVVALYASLRAVGQNLSFATLMETRAIGSLSSHLMPVFQGSGLVEGSMASVLQRAGHSAGAALAAMVLYRMIQVWLPVAIGLTLFAPRPRLQLQARVRTLARAAYAMGALSVLAAIAMYLSETPDLDQEWLKDAGPSLLPVAAAMAVTIAWQWNRRRRLATAAIVNE